MRKSVYCIICLLFFIYSCGGMSNSTKDIKKNITIFYSNPDAGGFIDYASIDVTSEVSEVVTSATTPNLSYNLAIDKRVKKIGDYLTNKGYVIPVTPDLNVVMPDNTTFSMGVPIISTNTMKYYSYPSWFTKTTDYQGTRVIEIIDKNFENEVINIDENAVYGLPLKILLFITPFEDREYLHICLVDPVEYLEDFYKNAPDALIEKFKNEKNKILSNIKEALSDENNISFINETNYPEYNYSEEKSILKLASISGINIDNFTENFLKAGDIISTLDNGTKARYVPGVYPASLLNENQTEITGILSFCRFILPAKNIWLSFMPDNHTINYPSMLMLMPAMKLSDFNPPKSAPMEFIIKNSISHVYARYYPDNLTDEKYIKFSYKTSDGRKIYQLTIFDPYIAPAILTTGQWHKPFMLLNIYIKEEIDGTVGIYIKNPEYLITKYFSDITDESLKKYKELWNNDPNTMFYWPGDTKEKLGKISAEKITNLVKKTLDNLNINQN